VQQKWRMLCHRSTFTCFLAETTFAITNTVVINILYINEGLYSDEYSKAGD
jgi:hypothetical protein